MCTNQDYKNDYLQHAACIKSSFNIKHTTKTVDDEVGCDAKGTYDSILTVQVVSTGMAISGCLKAWERLLGTLAGVNLDRACRFTISSSHHDPVLKVNSTRPAENENNINIYS